MYFSQTPQGATGSCVNGGNDLTCSIGGICLPRSESKGHISHTPNMEHSGMVAILKPVSPDASPKLSPNNLKAWHAHLVRLMICNTRIRDSKVLLSSHLVVQPAFYARILRSQRPHYFWNPPSRKTNNISSSFFCMKMCQGKQDLGGYTMIYCIAAIYLV